MKNIMLIGGHRAVVHFDPDIEMFRGEFVDLNGGADFYAADVAGLRREGELSLSVFLDECKVRGVEPRKHFSGKFVLRLPAHVHAAAATAAAACGTSLNQWIAGLIEASVPSCMPPPAPGGKNQHAPRPRNRHNSATHR